MLTSQLGCAGSLVPGATAGKGNNPAGALGQLGGLLKQKP
jgi:hypothetical protein